MTIKFRNLVLEGFMSFGKAEVKLDNPGYILVSGHNKNPLDAALSNGSGKSSIFNAICWALTGETISGLKNDDVVNIHTDTGCKVELTFEVDGVTYVVTRYRKYPKIGNDLTLVINGEPKSGTTLTASEKILAEYLPELNTQLISSVILLGQGLPHKFSDNSPSGRKEVLEKLSESDFMLEDLKRRLTSREIALNQKMREVDDKILELTSKLTVYKSQQNSTNESLIKLNAHPDFDTEISAKTTEQAAKTKELEAAKLVITNADSKIESLNNIIIESSKAIEQKRSLAFNDHNKYQTELSRTMSDLNSNIRTTEAEITRLKSIKDVCPTCGQKLPGVLKPDTTEQEKLVQSYYKQKEELQKQMDEDNVAYTNLLKELDTKYMTDTKEARDKIEATKAELTPVKVTTIPMLETKIGNLAADIAKLTSDKANYINTKKSLEESLVTINNSITEAEAQISYNNKEKSTLAEHLDVNAKMTTLIRRDFRGILLKNVIDFMSAKLKEYCAIVFDTDDIDFVLEGNNINITFCKKPLEALSGGEQQKVNICIQLALRDMLCQYRDFSSNILAIDEVFDQLDTNGCTRVLDLISSRLTDVESIYIISHHTDLSCPSDLELIVEKDEHGVSSIK